MKLRLRESSERAQPCAAPCRTRLQQVAEPLEVQLFLALVLQARQNMANPCQESTHTQRIVRHILVSMAPLGCRAHTSCSLCVCVSVSVSVCVCVCVLFKEQMSRCPYVSIRYSILQHDHRVQGLRFTPDSSSLSYPGDIVKMHSLAACGKPATPPAGSSEASPACNEEPRSAQPIDDRTCSP